MPLPSPLEDSATSAHAWARYRRMMARFAWVTLAVVIGVLAFLYDPASQASVHYYIAVALGVGGTMLLAGALMGLVFLSNGTGHDQSITDPLEDRRR